MNKKIKRNAARCKICGDVVESTYRHDFVTCSCGNVSVDGGHDYLRRSIKDIDAYEEVSDYEKNKVDEQ